jgi:hypothetical protein
MKISDYSSRSEVLALQKELYDSRESIRKFSEKSTSNRPSTDKLEALKAEFSRLVQSHDELKAELERTKAIVSERFVASKMDMNSEILQRLFIPSFDVLPGVTWPFMAHSTCSARDFFHPDFKAICAEIKAPPAFHRKTWEWVYLVHQLRQHGVLKPGMRGLGFGVGTEALPSMFASLGIDVMATDAPPEIGASGGWNTTGEFANNLNDLCRLDIVSREQFEKHVAYAPCDMNAIDEHLAGYDFCWSSCCLEHLGDMRKGLDFIVNSVEKTLKIGGVACHTTEFNMTSNDKTVEDGYCVLYRRRDIEEFVQEMTERGHKVEQFSIAPDTHSLDSYVDVPPYAHNPHLKLRLMGYVTTSVGLVITRGR